MVVVSSVMSLVMGVVLELERKIASSASRSISMMALHVKRVMYRVLRIARTILRNRVTNVLPVGAVPKMSQAARMSTNVLRIPINAHRTHIA